MQSRCVCRGAMQSIFVAERIPFARVRRPGYTVSGGRVCCPPHDTFFHGGTMATILETARLLLREFTEDDAPAFCELNRDPEVTRFTGDGHVVRDADDARAILRAHPIADYAKHGFSRWACVHKADGKVIGFAGLKYLDDVKAVDVGYRLLRACWDAGLATEATVPCVRHGFERLNLERIIGLVVPENIRSVRVLEKAGLTFEGMVECRSQQLAQYAIDRDGFRRLQEGER